MIVKLSSSGRAVQVVDDGGCVFQTSVEFVRGLLEGRSPSGFVLLTRLPFKVASGRYKPSPVYNPVSGEKEVYEGVVSEDSVSGDVQSVRVTSRKRERDSFLDKKVW